MPDCGRRWNTERSRPRSTGDHAGDAAYRLQVVGVALAFGVGAAIVLANLNARRVLPILLALMAFWFLVYMPRWRQKVRRRARSLRTGSCARSDR